MKKIIEYDANGNVIHFWDSIRVLFFNDMNQIESDLVFNSVRIENLNIIGQKKGFVFTGRTTSDLVNFFNSQADIFFFDLSGATTERAMSLLEDKINNHPGCLFIMTSGVAFAFDINDSCFGRLFENPNVHKEIDGSMTNWEIFNWLGNNPASNVFKEILK